MENHVPRGRNPDKQLSLFKRFLSTGVISKSNHSAVTAGYSAKRDSSNSCPFETIEHERRYVVLDFFQQRE